MVIPLHLVAEVAEECQQMERYERFVLERVQAGAAVIGLYPCTQDENRQAFAAWVERSDRAVNA